MKGDPKLTIKMKNAHTKYAIDPGDMVGKDGEPLPWKDWLSHNGYELDDGGQVYPMSEEKVNETLKQYR